jgi:hypothetical protein
MGTGMGHGCGSHIGGEGITIPSAKTAVVVNILAAIITTPKKIRRDRDILNLLNKKSAF